VKAKLGETSGFEAKLAELRASVKEEEAELQAYLAKEKRRRLAELDTEMSAFQLFDRGWSTEEVSFKLGLPETTVFSHLQQWGQVRKDRRIVKRELLRACLKKHIAELKNQQSWTHILPSTPEERLEELEGRITDCQRLLATPSRITKGDRAFLLGEYSAAVLSVGKKTTGNSSCKLLQE